MNFLYTEEGQEIAAKHNIRPRNAAVLKKHAAAFKPIQLFRVEDYFGSFALAQKTHFDDGGQYRQLHQHTNPEKMQDYLIGQKITVNRATLKTSAQVIINKTEAERGPGIDTEFIVKTTNDLAAFEGKNAAQLDESITAQNMRVEREAKVASIVERGQTIKTAADRAWPYTNPANAGSRRKFNLPENRPYVP